MTRQPSDERDSAGDAGPLPGIPATERQQVEQLTQMFAAIVESSDDAIIAKTLDGVITSWNRAAERIFGYAADEIIGRPISILKPPGHSEDVIQILEHIRHGERVNHFETKRCTKDGRIIDVSLSVSPIRDADGKISGPATTRTASTRTTPWGATPSTSRAAGSTPWTFRPPPPAP